jgi:tetratricopeptide (TPR) repeat protein
MMGRFTRYLFQSFRTWERVSQLSMLLDLLLLVVTILVALVGPPALRQPALIGFFGLVVVAQIIFMWSNRGMVTSYTQAQRAYLAEDFETARRLLEQQTAGPKVDAKALTLLGNTYRQLGLLDKSEQVLTKALALRPEDHFPRYGFGRTLLVQGRYAEAAEALQRAVEAGAPPIAQVDLGEALYRAGESTRARTALRAASHLQQEPHRTLMVGYLLNRLGEAADVPPLAGALDYWQEQAERYRSTPYGAALAEDVQQMRILIEQR